MGAQRWLMLGPMQIQPSEITKVAVILVLARYYHGLQQGAGRALPLRPAAARRHPGAGRAGHGAARPRHGDDGAAGRRRACCSWPACGSGCSWSPRIAAVGCLPLAWSFMHEYQRKRVLTFLDPDRDPLGAGYHITQSKIAIGSGGLFGKGFLQGHAVVAELPAREADRLHLHHLRRGVGHGGRLRPARPVRPDPGLGLLDRACAASTISAAWWRSASPP